MYVALTGYKGAPRGARQVACGSAHALAVDVFGHVYGWGSDRYGQLGLFVRPPGPRKAAESLVA